MYINCHSYYSLRYGTLSEKELLALAQHMQLSHFALTDINNTSACLNFTRIAPQYGIHPVIGIDFRNGADQLYIGLAKNNAGFLELNNFLSQHKHAKEEFPKEAPAFENAYIIYPYKKAALFSQKTYAANEFIGVAPGDLSHLIFSPLKELENKLVILQTVTFNHRTHFNTHRLLRAIDNNTLLSKLPKTEEGDPSHTLLPPEELIRIFAEYPSIIPNTQKLLASCKVHFDFSKNRQPQNQRFYTDSAEKDYELIVQLCEEGIPYRYGHEINEKITERLENELTIIRKMGFVSYFLINWDIVRYAQNKNYFYVGRGSGANSLVAYLLRITDVDPIELDLYFERFINLYRTNPPDFDIDFSWRDRQDVTRYIFSRFPHTALLATYNTFQYRAAVRELGKVFGLPKQELDKLSDGKFKYQQLDHLQQLVVQYSQVLQDKPNHLSVHSSGIIIADKPIHYYSATDMPPKGFPTTQFDMIISEDVGLFKFDILGQRGLAKIKECLQIVRYNKPNLPPIDIHNIKAFKKDKKINALIAAAQCIGCFYVESPAMRMLLKKLAVDNYLGLVAASSIIRPGVAKSGMMREYILRHRDPDRAKREAQPTMLEIMPETYGVMVYQEDVIKVAHYFAGLTLSEADVLRRAMSGKFRSRTEFEKIKQSFFKNCKEREHADKDAQEIWRQIESFAGYAFAKGHSASYAVESYQTLYLKCYHPLEYMVAILNNGGGFYRSELYVHEARMLGAQIHAPCVNTSEHATIIKGKDIYLGFAWLQNMESETAYTLIEQRENHGPYTSLQNFIERIAIGIEQLSVMIRIGAFRCTGIGKRHLLWEAHSLLNKFKDDRSQQKLFAIKHKAFKLPSLHTDLMEHTFDEMEILGFPLSDPFLLLAEAPWSNMLTKDFSRHLNKFVSIFGYLVARKSTSASGGKRMAFGTFLDQEGHFIDTVHFPQVAAKYPFRGRGVYLLSGKVVEEFGFYSMEVQRMEKMAFVPDPRYGLETEEVRRVG
ncbi:MAG: error-prone DNA polymerase [Chitinophagales bacterium]|jgi:DNA polymerase-3 subunit alpha